MAVARITALIAVLCVLGCFTVERYQDPDAGDAPAVENLRSRFDGTSEAKADSESTFARPGVDPAGQ